MAYTTTASAITRLPGRTIDADSSPSTTEVDAWVAEAEALLDGALDAGQIATPVTDAGGVSQLKSWADDYVEGRIRKAFASAGGDGNNDDGETLLTRFEARIEDILTRPARYASMLQGGSAGDSARRIRGHVLDNADSKTVTAGDFAPTFTRNGENF